MYVMKLERERREGVREGRKKRGKEGGTKEGERRVGGIALFKVHPLELLSNLCHKIGEGEGGKERREKERGTSGVAILP